VAIGWLICRGIRVMESKATSGRLWLFGLLLMRGDVVLGEKLRSALLKPESQSVCGRWLALAVPATDPFSVMSPS
jgi:hypothetical protein